MPAWTSRALLAYLGGGAVLLALSAVVDAQTVPLVHLLVSLLAITGVAVGVLIFRPAGRAPWFLLAAGLVALLIADAVRFSAGASAATSTYPDAADAVLLAAYLPMTVSIGLLIRRRLPGQRLRPLIQGLVVGAVGLLLLWHGSVHAFAGSSTTLIEEIGRRGLPYGDVILLGGITYLLLGGSWRSRSLWLVVSGLALLLAADLASSLMLRPTDELNTLANWLRIGSYLVIGVAALVPSMRSLDEVDRSPQRPWTRGHILALIVLISFLPVTLVVQQITLGHVDLPPVIAAGVALVLGLMLSVNDLASRAAHQDRRQAVLLSKASDAFAIADADGTITYASPASERVLGSPVAELVGRSVKDFVGLVDPSDLAGPGSGLLDVFATPGTEATQRLRVLDVTGTERWLEVAASNRTADPDIRGIVLNYHDVTDEVIAQMQLRDSHDLLIATEELAHVGSWALDTDGNPPVWSDETWRILGLDPATTPTEERSFDRSVHPDDLNVVQSGSREALATGKPLDVEFRIIRPDGEMRYLRGVGRVERDDSGRVTRIIGANLDVTEARHATELLRVQADILANLREAVVVTDLKGRITHWGGGAATIFGYAASEMSGQTLASIYPGLPKNAAKVLATRLAGGDYTGEWEGRHKHGSTIWLSVHITDVRDSAGQPTGFLGVATDVSAGHASAWQLARMSAAIEQSSESIMITNTKAEIEYVNPAFERSSGYSRSEVFGRNPRLVQSGQHDASFYRAMWDALGEGQPWVADFMNRRKDGTLFQEESVISAIHDTSGAISGYIAVSRDVTELRNLEARTVRQLRERALIAGTIRALSGSFRAEETAEAICRQVVSMAEANTAGLFIFELDDHAAPYGFAVAEGATPPRRRLDRERTAYLRDRVNRGPWIEGWHEEAGQPYHAVLQRLGVRAIAYAPIRNGELVIGFLQVSSTASQTDDALVLSLPALVEFAEIAGTVLGVEVATRTEVETVRRGIKQVISERAYSAVFQPIVDIMQNKVVGYEALTRFRDGVAPDVRFEQAAKVGLGVELELATLEAAMNAAADLPAAAWLNVNASPELVFAGTGLAAITADYKRDLVLEVTEHTAIADYHAFRTAVELLGPKITVAVDDAGAGFASLQHILEVRPSFVKLDRALISGIDTDKARRAMAAGMHHFARASGIRLIAEGVETEGELATLRQLDIHLAQGYLLGAPAPVPDRGQSKRRAARPAARRTRKVAVER